MNINEKANDLLSKMPAQTIAVLAVLQASGYTEISTCEPGGKVKASVSIDYLLQSLARK